MGRNPKSLDELLKTPATKSITAILKRGEKTKTVEFNPQNIAKAVRKASIASGINYDEQTSSNFALRVTENLQKKIAGVEETFFYSKLKIPGVEDIQETVMETFDELNSEILATEISQSFKVKYHEALEASRDLVRKVDPTGAFYQQYKIARDNVRASLVNLPFSFNFDSTDKQLGIHLAENGRNHTFDSESLKTLILEKTNVDYIHAERAVKKTEEILANRNNSNPVEKDELVSIVDATLMEQGYVKEDLLGGGNVGVRIEDVEQLIFSKSVENSNIQSNNPEAVNLGVAELASKEYALRKIFDPEVAKAHKEGAIHIHDLGYAYRVYCSAHSIEYIKKFGLDKVVTNLDSKSKPAGDDPKVLNNHLQTFLAAIQSSYAGALGFPMLNTLYGPTLLREDEVVEGFEMHEDEKGKQTKIKRKLRRGTLEELSLSGQIQEFEETNSYRILSSRSKKELKEGAQNLIFGASQSAFSRGGQTLFIDFNIDLGTPAHVRNVPAIFSKANYLQAKQNKEGEWVIVNKLKQEPDRFKGTNSAQDGDVIQPKDGTIYMTYGNELVEKASQDFAEVLLEIFKEGDKYGNPFNFPKCDVHVSEKTYQNEAQEKLLRKATEATEHNDSVYYMYDRGDGMNVAQCCRLRERITDPELLKHPEKMRFCGFQNISINLPQASYKSEGGNLEEKLNSTLNEIDKVMDLALKAHTNKRRFIQKLLDTNGSPLRSMGMPSDDGEPYIDLSKSTYIMGIVGLNEVVQNLTGKELHEDPEAFKIGSKIISHMYSKKNEMFEKYGMKIVLEETPGESANRRLAKLDKIKYKNLATDVIKGNHKNDEIYYTNSAHLNPNAPVSGLDRAILQAKMNPMIEAGAITHLFTGERENKANAVYDFVKSIFYNTQSSQVVFSGEHTTCFACGTHTRGLEDKCGSCGNEDQTQLKQKTRVVGYFSDPRQWNKSKKGELKARQEAVEYYAGETPSLKNLEGELYESIIDEGKLRIAIIGTPECDQCDRAYSIAKKQAKKIKEQEIDVEIVKYNLKDENDRVNAMIYNAPLESYPSVVVHKGNKVERFTSEFPYLEKAKTINTPILKEMVDSVLE